MVRSVIKALDRGLERNFRPCMFSHVGLPVFASIRIPLHVQSGRLMHVSAPRRLELDTSLTATGQILTNVARNAGYSFPHHIRISSTGKIVDLRSDTVTLPTESMRRAMAGAVVGDDVYQEDPTLNELEAMAAKLFGTEAALFVPSGTMGNLICVLVHCRERSAEALLGDKSHIFMYEQGGISHLGGVHPRTVLNLPDGTFLLSELESKFRVRDVHYPISSVICIENTHNVCGGKVLPIRFIDAVAALGKTYNVPVHCDGARLYNAAISLNVPVARLMQGVSSVSMCLSKALSAPIGSLVGGSAEFIWLARRLRKAVGGGMRQAGIVAAAGIVALEEMPPKLALDHERAQYLAGRIYELRSPFFRCDPTGVHSNIIMVELPTARMPPQEFSQRMFMVTDEERRVLGKDVHIKLFPFGVQMARMVIHHSITQEDVEMVAAKLSYLARELELSDTVVSPAAGLTKQHPSPYAPGPVLPKLHRKTAADVENKDQGDDDARSRQEMSR